MELFDFIPSRILFVIFIPQHEPETECYIPVSLFLCFLTPTFPYSTSCLHLLRLVINQYCSSTLLVYAIYFSTCACVGLSFGYSQRPGEQNPWY
ncbi:hypothetical protein BGX38DRAFT_704629 [Terfezia claveryi]|nr:hypothetical protein BGX38DRAFT_704629 [Terfezia claveryi]